MTTVPIRAVAPRRSVVCRAAALALVASLAASSAAAITFLNASTCANSSVVWRPCTTFELNPAVCKCPGAGPEASYVYLTVGSLLTATTTGSAKKKAFFAVNGTVPGPTVTVTEGDWVVATVTNLHHANTTMHWHGMTHVLTPYSDGVPGVTQCDIRPGATMVYQFRAASAGTYWYHGHLADQYEDGLYGPMIVKPLPSSPQPPPYDDDITLSIMDFYNDNVNYLVHTYFMTPLSGGVEPIPDAIMVNGKFSQQLVIETARNRVSRLRFIAAASLSMFTVSIDGLNMRVIEVDGTDTVPYEVSSFTLNVAQRVSVLVDWSQLPTHLNAVYLRVTAMADMYPVNISTYIPPYEEHVPGIQPLNPNFLGVFQLSLLSSGTALPPYDAFGDARRPVAPPAPNIIPDTNLLDARPVQPLPMPAITHNMYMSMDFFTDDKGINRASFNMITHSHSMDAIPSLYLAAGYPGGKGSRTPATMANASSYPLDAELVDRSTVFPSTMNLPSIKYSADAQYLIPQGAVVMMMINNTDAGEHPIHVHGHTFWVISSSDNPTAETKFRDNYMRRDVVSVPALGWAKIAFVAEHPSVWAVHCHIGFHLNAGLLLEMIEAPEAILGSRMPANHLALCGIAGAVPVKTTASHAAMLTAAAPNNDRLLTSSDIAGLVVGVFAAGVLVMAVVFVLVVRSRDSNARLAGERTKLLLN